MADLVALAHGAFALFVLAGTALILTGLLLRWAWVRNPGFRAAHLAAVLFVALRAGLGVPCPLTVLEDRLRTEPAESAAVRWAHTLALRGGDPDRFARSSAALAVLALGLFVLGGALDFRAEAKE
jgi:hypothetical protein